MSIQKKPWHGVLVASALPFKEDLSVDYDRFAAHVAFLAENGCDGIAPNGSLGEYQNLTPEERAKVIEVAVDASPDGFAVMAGTGAYGAIESRHWAEQAAEAGAQAVMQLPPNTYRANDEQVYAHYQEVAKAGLPIVAYNNPMDTKVDLTPEFVARLHADGLIVGIKEFTGDARRAYAIKEHAPDMDILIGTDDSVLEVGIAGAVGWVAGYPNAIPLSTVELYRLSTSHEPSDWAKARKMHVDLHPLLRWDTKTEFVESIKLSMDIVGRYGGPSRPPRLPLPAEVRKQIVADTEKVLAQGYQ